MFEGARTLGQDQVARYETDVRFFELDHRSLEAATAEGPAGG